MINWAVYPKSLQPPAIAIGVVSAFQAAEKDIDSGALNLQSNAVLAHLRPHLLALGFEVESGKKREEKICVPVLFGRNGRTEKAFDADAFHSTSGFVLEVEAGRAVDNNQFLKDLFQACMMQPAKLLGVAVRNEYRGSDDFQAVCKFFDTLYASQRIRLPLQGVLIVGY